MIRRYKSIADTTITDRATYSYGSMKGYNYGQSDSIQVTKAYLITGSVGETRGLVKFDVDSIISDRAAGKLGIIGSTNFYMKFTPQSSDRVLPISSQYVIKPLTINWDEGNGTGLTSTFGMTYGYPLGTGSTWIYASSSSLGLTSWTTQGGDFDDSTVVVSNSGSFYEEIIFDVTDLVEEWVAGSRDNYGVGLFVSASVPANTQQYSDISFASRSSEYWFYRPQIEAQWDDSKKDNRGNFQPSSSLLSSADNLNDIYFYNNFRGQLKDLPFPQTDFYVRFFDGVTELNSSISNPVTGSRTATGIYSASVAIDTTSSTLSDKWYTTTSGSTPFFTGRIEVDQRGTVSNYSQEDEYMVKIVNMKDKYYQNESPIFRAYTRRLNWTPSIYSSARRNAEVNNIENMFYKVNRVQDDYIAIDYITGSTSATRVSYDTSGSYFQINMDELEHDYMYEIKLCYHSNSNYKELPQSFKFRVEKDNDR
jgi:hypothetical protein